MSSLPLPALDIRPPQQPPNMLEQYGQLQALKNQQVMQPLQQQAAQNQVQSSGLQLQQQQQDLKDQQGISKWFMGIDPKDPNAFDPVTVGKTLAQSGVSGKGIMAAQGQLMQHQQTVLAMTKDQLNNQQELSNNLYNGINGVIGVTDPQQRTQLLTPLIQQAVQAKALQPQQAQQMLQNPAAITDDQLKAMQHGLGVSAAFMASVARQQTAQTGANTEQAAHGPLSPDQIQQLNQGFTQRWNVLNQGKPQPAAFQLPPNATADDFNRVDKLLQGTEASQQTAAQQQATNGLRQQMIQIAAQNAENAQESRQQTMDAKNMKWATGTDANGNQIAGPVSQLESIGAKNLAELPAQEVRDVQNARHAVTLMEKQGDPSKPETMGTLQLIDSLDKDGKLGLLASRWNRLETQGIGTSPGDDPRIITLIDKNMLADTATMLAHFGASGGRSPQMLQHFTDLSNAGKMDGVTLRAGTKAMADYMHDRAMMPSQASGASPAPGTPQVQQGGAPKIGDVKTFPNGKKGKWDGTGWEAQ